MKKLPVGIQNFERIITNDYLYVDKTQIIYNLLNAGSRYFLARPRRFGKSVLVSTLESLLRAKKELFKDCWIAQSPYQWQEHTVIRLDFSDIARTNAAVLEASLRSHLCSIAVANGLCLSDGPSNDMIGKLIQRLGKHKPIALLVDEYDKPMLDSINDSVNAQAMQQVLAAFYSSIKAQDKYLNLVFITGVARVARTSIFSGMNNLIDITYRDEYAQIVGYAPEELGLFSEHIDRVANKNNQSSQEVLDTIREWYNGFRFSYNDLKVYNPFSTLRYLESGVLSNYWFTSGTPGFLANIFAQYNFVFDGNSIESLDGISVSADSDLAHEIDHFPLVSLLFQSGYLTVKEYCDERQTFTLTYPNKETRESFLKLYAERITNRSAVTFNNIKYDLLHALDAYDFETFFELLTSFFAGIAYDIHIPLERYYQSLFYVILRLVGADIIVEKKTNIGRIDAVITTDRDVIILEYKIDQDPAVALAQIREKQYYRPYLNTKKRITLVGICFSSQEKNISGWIAESV